MQNKEQPLPIMATRIKIVVATFKYAVVAYALYIAISMAL